MDWWRGRALGEAGRARIALEKSYPGVSFGTDVQVIGLDTIRIGVGSCIGDRVWLNDCMRNEPGRLEIGRFTLIGRGGVITTSGRLQIGDFVVLGPDVYVADADHIFTDPMQPILQQGVTTGRSVIIEENCWLGIHAKIFGDLTVGRGSIVAAGSIVRKSVPPFAVVAGVPAKVVKLYDFSVREWRPVRDESELADMLQMRELHPVPERNAYHDILHRENRVAPLERLLAGANCSI
jgi:acetyltransferase-like isoleucine patch superfamily enzyme